MRIRFALVNPTHRGEFGVHVVHDFRSRV